MRIPNPSSLARGEGSYAVDTNNRQGYSRDSEKKDHPHIAKNPGTARSIIAFNVIGRELSSAPAPRIISAILFSIPPVFLRIAPTGFRLPPSDPAIEKAEDHRVRHIALIDLGDTPNHLQSVGSLDFLSDGSSCLAEKLWANASDTTAIDAA